MSDAEKAWEGFADANPKPGYRGQEYTAFMAGHASRDADVAEALNSGAVVGAKLRDQEVAEAEAVMLAIVDATSGPGDGPAQEEMVAGVAAALTMPASAAARAKWAALVAERDALRAVAEKLRAALPDDYDPGCDCWTCSVYEVLAAAPSGVLAERDADKWDEGHNHCFHVEKPNTVGNPYGKGADHE